MGIEKISLGFDGDYYEGEVKDGKPNGFGTRYIDFKPQYRGYFYNGLAYGFGTSYTEEGHVLYEGMFEDDCFSGEGIVYYPNKQKMLEGVFAWDELVNGKVFSPEGWLQKEGMFQNQQLHGEGTIYNRSGHIKCKGIFYQNMLIGIHGTFDQNPFLENLGKWRGNVFSLQSDALQVKMQFVDGVQHGETVLAEVDGKVRATFSFDQGKLFYQKRYINGQLEREGEVQEYDLNGHGKVYNLDGTLSYEGTMKNGKRHGRGRAILNGDILTAEYEYDIQQGEGEVHNQEGRLVYKGFLLDELIDGEGTYYYEDGTYFVGRMAFGFPQKGTYYNAKGQVIYQEDRQQLDLTVITSVYQSQDQGVVRRNKNKLS